MRVLQRTDRAVERDGLVNQAGPVAGFAAEQAQRVVVLRP